jgi:hypothetical protein
MDRRTLLRKAGAALAAAGAAGCLGRGPVDGQGEESEPGTGTATETGSTTRSPSGEATHTADHPSETPVRETDGETRTPTETLDGTEPPTETETPTATETETATPRETSRPRVVDAEFAIRSVGAGRPDHEATIAASGEAVVVEGSIPGSNGCYRAELAGADHEDGRLTVLVRSYEDADDDTACTQSVVEIEYRAEVTFDGGLPDAVQVDHEAMGERQTVTTATVG